MTKVYEKEPIGNACNGYFVPPLDSMIVGQNLYYSRDCYQTKNNNHFLGVGASGAGKTRGYVRPNIMMAEGSFLVSDPKGNLHRDFAPYLKSKGFKVRKIDFNHPERSMRYNPFARCKTIDDVCSLAMSLVYLLGDCHSNDAFWPKSEDNVLRCMLSYIVETMSIPLEEKTIVTLCELLRETQEIIGPSSRFTTKGKTAFDMRMEEHKAEMESRGLKSWAYDRYKEFSTAPDKTRDTIVVTAMSDMSKLDTPEIRKMLSGDDFDFTELGTKKVALFVEVSDTDRSKDLLVNLFYTQVIHELCVFADEKCKGSRLPVGVQFILDDFGTTAKIGGFQNIISNIRSRNMSVSMMIQSEAQLESFYGNDARTIIDNVDTYCYMGSMNVDTARMVAIRTNRSVQEILNMPIGKEWVFRRGQKPVCCDRVDLEWLEKVMGFEAGKPCRFAVKAKKKTKNCSERTETKEITDGRDIP